MTARERIENLTNSWYGFALVSGLVTLLSRGFGIFALITTGFGTAFSLFVTYFLGKRLLSRSSLTRSLLLAVSVLGATVGTLWTIHLFTGLLGNFGIGQLVRIVGSAVWVGMYVQSFRVLIDKTVKSYFA